MPKLSNAQHEEFAQNLAKGMQQVDAFALAGFAPNKSHASRCAARPEVKARVKEIRDQRRAEGPPLPPVPALVPTTDAPQNLTEAGYSKMWFADAYRRIAAAAEEQGQLNHAVTALARIQGMYESEVKDEPEAPAADAAPHINIDVMNRLLQNIPAIIAISKAPDLSAPLSVADNRAHRAAETADEEA